MSEKYSEQIFDYLLEEWLTGQQPPDLTKRIEAAWMREKSGDAPPPSSPLVVAELVEQLPGQEAPPNSSSSDLSSEAPSGQVQAIPVSRGRPTRPIDEDVRPQPRTNVPNGSPNHGISPRRSFVASLLAISAALFLAVVGWNAWMDYRQTTVVVQDPGGGIPGSSEDSRIGQPGVPSPLGPSLDNAIADVQETPPQGGAGDKRVLPEELDLQNLPFGSRDMMAGGPEVSVGPTELLPTEKLSDAEIVAGLDRRLADLWSQVGVEAQQRLSDLELARKTHRTLAGRDLPVEWEAKLLSDETSWERWAWASEVTSSQEFSRHWASQVTRQWLKRGSLPLDGKPVQMLTRQVALRIANSEPWNEVPVQLLSGDLSGGDGDNRSLDNPSAVFVSALSGGGNHRLVKRLGINFLNVNLACVRCHDASYGTDRRLAVQQQTYWSLVALLNGIEATGNGYRGTRQVTDRQQNLFAGPSSPAVFYERLDGLMKAADAHLPDGTAWNAGESKTPREALAAWLSESQWLDRAVVNQTWKTVFGRHLVPQVEGVDLIAPETRGELLDFLAGQFRAHDHDLKQLVAWIVSSDAFSRATIQLNSSEWLEATDEELERLQLAELVFAAGPTVGRSPESKRLESSLAAVIQWSNPSNGLGQNETTLGQFDAPGGAAKRAPRHRTGNSPMPALSFAIHGERHTAAEHAFVKRLLNSKRLDWEQRVEHIVAISEYEVASERIQQLGKDLLQNSGGDAEAVLLDLLWAVKNSDAG